MTPITRHALDRGDWTQLKTPVVVWLVGCAKRLTGKALAPPVFAKVQSQQRERPDSSARNTTTCIEIKWKLGEGG
jgi:hypothetical protein